MPSAQPTSAPRRRNRTIASADLGTSASLADSAKPKKLPKGAVEATAEAFMAAFQALPGAVQWRIVQLIEEQEDNLDAQELAAARAINPEDFDPANAITLEEYMSQRRARVPKSGKADSLAA